MIMRMTLILVAIILVELILVDMNLVDMVTMKKPACHFFLEIICITVIQILWQVIYRVVARRPRVKGSSNSHRRDSTMAVSLQKTFIWSLVFCLLLLSQSFVICLCLLSLTFVHIFCLLSFAFYLCLFL